MNKPVRFVLVVYSILLALISLLLLYSFADNAILTYLDLVLNRIIIDPVIKWVYFSILLCIIISSVWAVSYSLL